MKMDNVRFIWSSEEILKRADEYWALVFDIACKNSLQRVLRCTQIMGRNAETDDLSAAQIFYPVMQCADIFFLKVDICQLGMDQRKVNMLAREYCTNSGLRANRKPIILSHHMLMGLKEGHEKMSKSDPESAIFMEDSEEEVNSKIKKAFCPPGVVEKNPVLDYAKHLIFSKAEAKLHITRKAENGGDVLYERYEELEADFVALKLHPSDLKRAVAQFLNEAIKPVREHFINDPHARDLLKRVKSFKVSR